MQQSVPWLILTALGLEYSAVRERLTDCSKVVHPRGSRYEVGQAHAVSVALVECGAGNTGAAVECERAISYFQPKVTLFVGVAGGIKDVRLGDVVFASKVYSYESGKAEKSFRPRPLAFVPNYALLQEAKEIARNSSEQSRAVVGPIAAGEKVIASIEAPEFLFIKQQYGDSVAVEMEGYGFLQAGYANNADCMVIRGISDLIEDKDSADASGSQPLASRNAAAFALQLIEMHEMTAPSTLPTQEALATIAERLYPIGPNENQLWERAGGNIALLPLNQPGRPAWFSAIKALYLGGGGESITVEKLIKTMLLDHTNNPELRALL